MSTCFFVSDESDSAAQEFRFIGKNGMEALWLAEGECSEPLFAALSKEVPEWEIEEYYTEDDDHGDAFRYFDSETINHAVTVETAIVADGGFAGALFRSKADGSLIPVLVGAESIATGSERLSDTHELAKQSTGRLVRKSEK